jgi:hypothetical protein
VPGNEHENAASSGQGATMCLLADANATMKLRKRKGVRRAWKVYRVTCGVLEQLYYGRCITRHGVVKSNRARIPKRVGDRQEIHHGIHVYTTRRAAEDEAWGYGYRRVVPVTVRCIDLVAANPHAGEAVFMSIHISKQAFRKATKAQGEP